MNTLVVLLGPTGVGKTALSLRIARRIESPILSADSQQLYKELVIGTTAPTADERADGSPAPHAVDPHAIVPHGVGTRPGPDAARRSDGLSYLVDARDRSTKRSYLVYS